MKINFLPQRHLDAGAGAAAAGMGSPLGLAMGATQVGVGLLQGLLGGFQRRKAMKDLNKLEANAPKYQQNQSILDYYNKALQRYNVNPTDSALYKRQTQNVNRSTASGIRALQDSGDVLGGISSLVQGQNDAMLNAEAAAENEKSNRFGQLGGATGMKADEDRMAFQVNQMSPFERKYNLLAQKAGGGSQIANAGIQNAFSGLQNYSNMQMIKNMYGG